VTVQSTLHTIPIGVILSMQPSVDLDSQEITLHVRPTLSVIANKGQPDPAVALLAASIGNLSQSTINQLNNNTVPVVQVRELDTMLKIKSGEVMIIGGLISHNDQDIEQGVPYASRIPFFGSLLKTNQVTNSATETIILIQATILTPNGYYHKHDKKLYEDFTNDPLPLVF
jgi:general secretion pathway protein D